MIQSLESQLNTSDYPIVQNISAPSFTEKNVNKASFSISDSGDFLLSTGDYSIPVMTYCMKPSSSSPTGHVYTLGQMEGKLSPIIKKLNLKAPAYFPTSDIQIVLWSLQAGISYEEMTKESQIIIDQIVPEHRDELKKSSLSSVEKKWNQLAEKSGGTIPKLGESMDRLQEKLGGLESRLSEMRSFREKIREFGHDYQELSRLVDTSPSNKKSAETSWSKISENIYARFVTQGSFGDIGFLQIRVLQESGRKINSEGQTRYSLNIASLIANPNDPAVQPLSFSPLFGIAGVAPTSNITADPRAAALLIALALTVYPMDWDDFFKLKDLLEDVKDKNVQKGIKSGNNTLRKEHDELERPLREEGIVTGKTKNTSKKESNKIRQYTKPGGSEQMKKDFERIKGELSKSDDGMDVKTLPDGTKIVKRPTSDEGPTIEVQPSKSDPKYPDHRIRIKVRYQ